MILRLISCNGNSPVLTRSSCCHIFRQDFHFFFCGDLIWMSISTTAMYDIGYSLVNPDFMFPLFLIIPFTYIFKICSRRKAFVSTVIINQTCGVSICIFIIIPFLKIWILCCFGNFLSVGHLMFMSCITPVICLIKIIAGT